MTKKQLLVLFLCNLINWMASNGIISSLPVYLTRMGEEPSVIGNYLAFGILSNCAGLIVGGWFSERWHRRRLLLSTSGAAFSLTLLLMSQSKNIWQLTVFTSLNWFFSGVGQTLVIILAGLFSQQGERGRIFGILGMTQGLGVLLGGLIAGRVASLWGYPSMIAMMAGLSLIWWLAALFVKDKVVSLPLPADQKAKVRKGYNFSLAFYCLLLSGSIALVPSSIDLIARPLLMDSLKFDAAAISSTDTISGAIMLPLTPLIGWLGDRFGRLRLWIGLCYILYIVAIVGTSLCSTLWHFWITTALYWIAYSCFTVVGTALCTALLSEDNLDMGLSLFNTTQYLPSVIGFVLGGYLIEKLGIAGTYMATAFLPLLGILLLLPSKIKNKPT